MKQRSSPCGSCRRRSIGDRAWKGSMGGLPGSLKLARSVPETRYVVAWLDDRVMNG